MATIETLTAKIIADSEAKAKEIAAAAEAEARRIVDEAVAEAEKEAERILAAAETEAARKREQMVLSQTLAIRDQNLGAKGETISTVFADALERLENMPRDRFIAFITKRLAGLDLDGQQLILPKKYGIADLAEIGSPKGVTLYNGAGRDISGGFILIKDGIEQNNTFEAMVDFYRYELEGEVLKALY